MGKDWDRLTAPSGGAGFDEIVMPDGAARLPRPSYTGSPNPTCFNCGGTQRGNDRRSFKRCRCDVPEFPNVLGKQGRAMQSWHEAWLREAWRVLRPGGHLIAFGGGRTHHRLWCAAEDAGFEIRDTFLAWIHGQGFNKGGYVSYKLERALTRRVDGRAVYKSDGAPMRTEPPFRHPEADSVWHWAGSLKPAFEPVMLARRPLAGTVARNMIAHGVGALHVDACRVGASGGGTNCTNRDADGRCLGHANAGRSTSGETIHAPLPQGGGAKRWSQPRGGFWATNSDAEGMLIESGMGRYPPNVLLQHTPECERVGTRRVPAGNSLSPSDSAGATWQREQREVGPHYADADGMEEVAAFACAPECPIRALDAQAGDAVSRFFPCFQYQSKASGDDERWFYCRVCRLAGPKSLAAKHARCVMPDEEAGAGGERQPERAVVYHPT